MLTMWQLPPKRINRRNLKWPTCRGSEAREGFTSSLREGAMEAGASADKVSCLILLAPLQGAIPKDKARTASGPRALSLIVLGSFASSCGKRGTSPKKGGGEGSVKHAVSKHHFKLNGEPKTKEAQTYIKSGLQRQCRPLSSDEVACNAFSRGNPNGGHGTAGKPGV